MASPRKRKPRKKRLVNLSKLGFKAGQLYEFRGKSRLLYREQFPRATLAISLPKICPGDHLMFLKAELWECDAQKTKTVWEDSTKQEVNKLKSSNNRVLKITPTHWNSRMATIHYRSNEPLYSGMLQVGYEDKFGWVNVVQMSKSSILQQFKQVTHSKQE